MKAVIATWAAAVVFALAGVAAAADVNTQFDRGYDFSKIKTFHAKVATGWGNPIGESNVLHDIEQGIAARGWQSAPEGQADAEVLIHGSTKQRHNLNTFYTGMGGGWGYRGFGGMGMATAQTTVNDYTEGTLLVDIYDAKTKQLIWRGTAVDEIKEKQDKREKQMEKVSEKLFKKFPPGAEK
jgi:hypothetical protein